MSSHMERIGQGKGHDFFSGPRQAAPEEPPETLIRFAEAGKRRQQAVNDLRHEYTI